MKEQIPEVREILIGNLAESLKQSQRYVVIAFGASVFAVLLALGTPGDIKAPIGPAEILVRQPVAIALAYAVFWVAGVMASLFVLRIKTIIAMIHDPDVVIASVTYPSILTIRPFALRRGVTLLPPVLAVTALLYMYGYQLRGGWQIAGMFLLIGPNVSLAIELWHAVGEAVRDERAIEKVCAKAKTAAGEAITREECFVISNFVRDGDSAVCVRTGSGDTYFLVAHCRDIVREFTADQAVKLDLAGRSKRRKR